MTEGYNRAAHNLSKESYRVVWFRNVKDNLTAEDFNVQKAGYPAAAEARRSALRLQVRDLRAAFYGPVAVGNRPHCPIKLCANRR